MRGRSGSAVAGALAALVAVVLGAGVAVAEGVTVVASVPAIGGAPTAAAVPRGDPNVHLDAILDRSPAPEYRRFGSPGLAAAADYAVAVLAGAGYVVQRVEATGTVFTVDRSPGHEPSLVRADGRSFRTETAFSLERTTGPEGLTCTVRAVADVGPGDCGFVPFEDVSPAWNAFTADPAGAVAQVRAQGGVAAILQGDLGHDALLALRIRQPTPTVVSLVRAEDVVGQRVHLRIVGATGPATLRNVLAVRPPADPARGYVLVQGHLDGWFAAAADNGGGAAAVLAAAERLAGDRGGRGLLVALYDGEEWGLQGSQAVAAQLRRPEGLAFDTCGPVVHLDDVVAVVNLDAPSAIASDLVGPDAAGTPLPLVQYRILVASAEPTMTALLAAAMTGSGVLGLPLPVEAANLLNGGITRTDGRWFEEAGIPVGWPVAGYPEYHSEADRRSTVDPADLDRVTAGAVALVRSLDGSPIGRLPGSTLAAPGSTSPPACAPTTSTSAAPAPLPVTTVDGAARLPVTGGSEALLPAGGALLLLAVLVAWVPRTRPKGAPIRRR